MWRIEFKSDEFLPLLPEEAQGNPGVYGFELAWWLAQELAKAGIKTSYPLGEDWGWLIEFIDTGGNEFTIGCGSMAEEGDGYKNRPIDWSIFVRPHTTLKQRLKGVSHEAAVQRLGAAIVATLHSKGIAVSQGAA
jgi:hypothetical protein